MDNLSGLASGGAIALMAALVVLIRELRRGRHETRSFPLTQTSEAIKSLSLTVHALQDENKRLGRRVEALEKDVSDKDARIDEVEAKRAEERQSYERQIAELESKLGELTAQVAAFREQITGEQN